MNNDIDPIIEDAKAAGLINDEGLTFAHKYIAQLVKFAQLREARTNAGSEAVAYKDAPKQIWLNLGDCTAEEIADSVGWDGNAEVTWSEDKIDTFDIPYVRADLTSTNQAVREFAEKVIRIIEGQANKYDEAYASACIDEINDLLDGQAQ